MEPLWYYRLFDTEFGPIEKSKLVELHDSGTLGDTDEVRAAETEKWSTYQDLFSRSQASPAVNTAGATSAVSPDDEQNWYYLTLGQELGPVSFNELHELVELGSLTADDEIKFGVNGKFRRVGSMGRLAAYLPYVESSSNASTKNVVLKAESPKSAPSSTANETLTAAVTPQYAPQAFEPAWFAFIRGVEYGPSSLVQLSQLAHAGQIAVTDFVKYGAYGTWMPPFPTIETTLAQFVVAPQTPSVPATTVSAAPATTTAVPTSNTASTPASTTLAGTAAKEVQVAKVTTEPVSPPVQASSEKTPKPSAAVEVTKKEETPTTQPKPVVAKTTPPPMATVTTTAATSNVASSRPAMSSPPMPARPPAKAASKSSGGGGLSIDFSALTGDPKTLGGIGVIVAVGLFFAFMYLLPASTAGEREKLEQLQSVYTEFKTLRSKNASDSEWQQFTTKAATIVDPIAKELQVTANRQFPARQCLLWASRDRFKDMLQNAREKPSPQEEEFDYQLKKAANYLGLGPDPDLERATAAVPNDT